MPESILRTKSKEFAKNIVFLCRKMKQNNIEGALINQLLRSGTSVGTNVHEAQYAHSACIVSRGRVSRGRFYVLVD